MYDYELLLIGETGHGFDQYGNPTSTPTETRVL